MTNGEACQAKDYAITLSIDEIPPDGEKAATILTLKAPMVVLAEKPFKITGTTEGVSQQVYLMLKEEAWGIDWFERDTRLASITSDGEGKFEHELQFDELGIKTIYVAQKKEWLGIDWLKGDIKSPYRTIFVLNYLIIGVVALAVLLVMWKKGLFKKVKRRMRK